MSVCPLEYRYGLPEMKRIFDETAKLEYMLEVEGALALAQARAGRIPDQDARTIEKAARSGRVRLERVKAIEKDTKHDIMALVKALAEQCGQSGRFVHLGATSNDIIDTASAIQIKEATGLLRADCADLRDALMKKAENHKKTVMLGRTHGQWAIPTTFGLKMAIFVSEFQRHLERLNEVEWRICVGKMSGAVGTGAGYGHKALELQDDVMKHLGLGVPDASNQVIQRDRYAEFVFVLANIGASIEKLATEIRLLQRSEVGEVFEPFDEKKQVGSSTMAHKRNPIVCENACGIARVIRGFVTPALENVTLWHERDLTNSSAERIIIPHACILTDYILKNMTAVVNGLTIREDVMRANLKATGGIIMAESVMLALTEKGMDRQEAHELLRQSSQKAARKGISLEKVLASEKRARKLLPKQELARALDYSSYIGVAVQTVERLLKKLK